MPKRVAIVQSSYIPWKGYFDLIRSVDEFILYDDMQYTKRDWRSRNRIKTPNGLLWLSIPVEVKGKFDQRICDAQVVGHDWVETHWRTLQHAYGKTPFFADYRAEIEDAYARCARETSLSRINYELIRVMCRMLEIRTTLTWSMDYQQQQGKTERLLSICQAAGADRYLSGPAAKDYMDVHLFESAGVQVAFADYTGYPEYAQPHPPFEHAVSALDLLFSAGPGAANFMKTFE
ncbi:WbqC family protein [Cognatiluteimonas profundi]|uniref:WbqC family protein n=1 Tax=Cognatiluteimonas profundi TaxID=2594501 RepID=UPI00131E0572|nr:WbqC family protein [Lysobacter profundi]